MLHHLPAELVALVGSFADSQSLLRLVAVNRSIRTALLQCPRPWRVLCLGSILPPPSEGSSQAGGVAGPVGTVAQTATTTALVYDMRVLRFIQSLASPAFSLHEDAAVALAAFPLLGRTVCAAVLVVDASETPIASAVWDLCRAFPNLRALSLAFCYNLRLQDPTAPAVCSATGATAGPGSVYAVPSGVSTEPSASYGHRLFARLLSSRRRSVPHLHTVYLGGTDVVTAPLLVAIAAASPPLWLGDVAQCRTCAEVIPAALRCRTAGCTRLVDICAACEDDTLNCDCHECESGAFLARICSACRPLLPRLPRTYVPPAMRRGNNGYYPPAPAPGAAGHDACPIASMFGEPSTPSPPATAETRCLVPPHAFLPSGSSAGSGAAPSVPSFPACPDRLNYFYCARHDRILTNCPACYARWRCPGCGIGYCWECWNWSLIDKGRVCRACCDENAAGEIVQCATTHGGGQGAPGHGAENLYYPHG
ncbi:hypothetical protein H9P43_004439 [Blastocladiella emersonii ATCC 22665]|nr:hypothetical protein H9P43_004439 [Blastocladiella emersonii ATCC 22665]